MPEVRVEKEKSLARPEPSGLKSSSDFFAPMFPFGRFFGMNPFGMNPFGMMREFGDQMDRMMRSEGTSMADWSPTVDVQRCNGDMIVTAELPGLTKDEIKVEATRDALTIEGERKREHKEDHQGFHRFERTYGKFFRAIPLPEGAKTDQAKAELVNGVLKISLPVPEGIKARRVPVEQTEQTKQTKAA
jgi:HSP20 family protein